MPVGLTPVDTWPSSFEAAQDGDEVNQLTDVDVMQEYADAATYLRNRSAPNGGVTVTVMLDQPIATETASITSWSVADGWVEANGNGDSTWWAIPPLILAPQAGGVWEIDQVTFYTSNKTTPYGSAPSGSNRQNVTLQKGDLTSAGGVSDLVQFFDGAASAAALNAFHGWSSSSGLGFAYDPSTKWVLKYQACKGASATPDSSIWGCTIDLILV